MTCLFPEQWPVQIKDDDPENGNEAEYKDAKDGFEHLKIERKDAKLNVVVCLAINLIVQLLMSLVDIAVKDSDMLDTLGINTTEANRANNLYKSMADVYGKAFFIIITIMFYKFVSYKVKTLYRSAVHKNSSSSLLNY